MFAEPKEAIGYSVLHLEGTGKAPNDDAISLLRFNDRFCKLVEMERAQNSAAQLESEDHTSEKRRVANRLCSLQTRGTTFNEGLGGEVSLSFKDIFLESIQKRRRKL